MWRRGCVIRLYDVRSVQKPQIYSIKTDSYFSVIHFVYIFTETRFFESDEAMKSSFCL